MPDDKQPFRLKLSPNVRLRMTVYEEMNLDPKGEIFNEDLLQRYIGMHNEAVNRQNVLAKTFLVCDIALAAVVFGKKIPIPGTGLEVLDLPAALQTLTILSAVAFLFTALTFLNGQMYQGVIEQFHQRRAEKLGIDPDFLSSAYVYTELWIKAFRGTMNFWTFDYFTPRRGYRAYYGVIVVAVSLALLSLLLLHLMLMGYALWLSAVHQWWYYLFATAVVLLSFSAICANTLLGFSFDIRPRNQSNASLAAQENGNKEGSR